MVYRIPLRQCFLLRTVNPGQAENNFSASHFCSNVHFRVNNRKTFLLDNFIHIIRL